MVAAIHTLLAATIIVAAIWSKYQPLIVAANNNLNNLIFYFSLLNSGDTWWPLFTRY
jgi:hypothetical protein